MQPGRRRCLTMLAAAALAASPVLGQAATARRLLIVDSQHGNPYDEIRAALLASLAAAGWREGRNLHVTLRAAGNDVAVGERLLREQADAHDVILVGGTVATLAAKNVLYGRMDRPVVFAAPTDPVGIGVIDSFDRPPKANFTGVSYPVPVKARLRFIRQLLPKARQFGLIYADMPQSHSYNHWLRELVRDDPEFSELTIHYRAVPLVTGEHGDRAMAEAAIPFIRELDARVDAFIKPNDQMGTRRPFAEVVHAHASKPLIGITRDDVMAGWGATASVYPSHESIGQQAAAMIRKLLAGLTPDQILPEWPKKYGFAVDLNKTRHFGITVPIQILRLAGRNIVR